MGHGVVFLLCQILSSPTASLPPTLNRSKAHRSGWHIEYDICGQQVASGPQPFDFGLEPFDPVCHCVTVE